jgi:hypothetical protein
MELRVETSQFAPNHGGGGGGFYQGRQGQAPRQDEDEATEEHPDQLALGADACQLPANRKSTLGLVLPPVRVARPVDLEGMDDEIHRNLRVMALMVIRLERDLERRLRVEIGDVVVGA